MSNSQLVIPVNAGGKQLSSLSWTRIVDKFGCIVRNRISMKISNVNEDSESWIDSIDSVLQEGQVDEVATCSLLSQRLESALREAKLKSVLTSEILIPCNLTHRISLDVIKMAEVEPCGLKGCVIYILLDDRSTCKRIGKVFCDPQVVSTFEVFLTLRKDSANNWLSLRNFMRRLGRSSPLVISQEYNLSKRKLYRSSSLED
ncbi:DNA damage-inducible transcript 4-like protein [Centruroides vittatus]|uniref:DNA damage-inducible transcript 4-like protein n=1 Tax=Centruroides vittatus TaxID=120091 RepID=UPI0035100C34